MKVKNENKNQVNLDSFKCTLKERSNKYVPCAGTYDFVSILYNHLMKNI